MSSVPVPEPLPWARKGEVRLTLKSGEVVTLYRATLVGDSIVGYTATKVRLNPQRVAVARAEVQSVAARQWSVLKTFGLVAGITLVTLGLLVVSWMRELGAT